MILTYCFIGPLPNYSIDTIHQARLFFKGDIYFIASDINSEYITILKDKYNVKIINYTDVISSEFNDTYESVKHKFEIIPNLKGREKLFIYSFERFFVLHNFMIKYNINNVFFIELDNLIYDNPEKWENMFSTKDLTYMFDNYDRCASGIFYATTPELLNKMNSYFLHFIKTSHKFINEMTALYEFWELNKDNVQLLPTIWPSSNVPEITFNNYSSYNDTIFDAAALGVYLTGKDTFHTNGIVVKGLKNNMSYLDPNNYKFDWKVDENGYKIPYVFNESDNKWIKINNLHVHSKHLYDNLSKQY